MSIYFQAARRTAGWALLLGALLLASACGEQAAAPQPATSPAKDQTSSTATTAPVSGVLNGTVSYRERQALPPNGTITVRLLDVSKQDAKPEVLAEQKILIKDLTVPVAYRLEYDPALIDVRLSYAVRAEIRGPKGRVFWTTKSRHPVLTRGAPVDNVEIRLEKVKAKQPASQPS